MEHLFFKIKGSDFNERKILSVLHGACDSAGAHIRNTSTHQFSPQGFTAVVVLSESHAALHTWPENKLAMVDYFSCSKEPNFAAFISYWKESGFEIVDPRIIVR